MASSSALRVAALLVVLLSAGSAAAAPQTSGDIGFKWFLASPSATGVMSGLASNGSVATIFAPSDAAMQELATALGVPTPQDILKNATLAKYTESTMALHIIPGTAVFSSDLIAGAPKSVKAQDGTPLTITKDSMGKVSVTVGGDPKTTAMVTFPDVRYKGSAVHVIDKVLLPAGLMLPTSK